jgi:hypothetical protein
LRKNAINASALFVYTNYQQKTEKNIDMAGAGPQTADYKEVVMTM